MYDVCHIAHSYNWYAYWMRMLNDFYCDIDNIMEKQASPYKTHSYNNIKVFFSVILSSIFMVTSDLEGLLVHVAQSNYNISSCVCMYCMISVLNVQEYIKVLLRWASSTTKHPHAHSPNSNVICLLFFATAHTLIIIAHTRNKTQSNVLNKGWQMNEGMGMKKTSHGML